MFKSYFLLLLIVTVDIVAAQPDSQLSTTEEPVAESDNNTDTNNDTNSTVITTTIATTTTNTNDAKTTSQKQPSDVKSITNESKTLPEKTTTTTTATNSTTSDQCRVHRDIGCKSSTDCCQWNTPDYKRLDSCGDGKYCGCVAPGELCFGGFQCCDGSICSRICPPVGKFGYCRTNFAPTCQSGLTCTVDTISQRIFPGWNEAGRCL